MATDLEIPANLRRTANKMGVTLSAGVEPKPAKAVSAKKSATTERVAGSKPKARKVVEAKPAPAVVEQPAPVVDADGNPLPIKRSIVPGRFKDKYKSHGGTCGDDMALELKAATTMLNADKRVTLDLPALKSIADANGIKYTHYEGLNNGQWRMNIGNKLRGKLAAGEDVVIGKRTFKAEDYEPKQPVRKVA